MKKVIIAIIAVVLIAGISFGVGYLIEHRTVNNPELMELCDSYDFSKVEEICGKDYEKIGDKYPIYTYSNTTIDGFKDVTLKYSCKRLPTMDINNPGDHDVNIMEISFETDMDCFDKILDDFNHSERVIALDSQDVYLNARIYTYGWKKIERGASKIELKYNTSGTPKCKVFITDTISLP